jgi:hypothetical protein
MQAKILLRVTELAEVLAKDCSDSPTVPALCTGTPKRKIINLEQTSISIHSLF